MTRDEFFEKLKDDYSIVKLLSEKNGAKSFVLKNKTKGENLVLRLFETAVPVYDYLKTISALNLPLTYDTVSLSDGQAVFEEYIEGLTVAEIIENGCFTYGGATKIISALCDALGILHKKGFIHRDIKPENVIISNSGKVKLIDFNAARKVKPGAEKDTVLIGTIGYASPEQLGLTQTTPATDIYALGVLLNVMLTGVHPSQKTAKGRAGKIIKKCTAITPADRYKTVEELKKDM